MLENNSSPGQAELSGKLNFRKKGGSQILPIRQSTPGLFEAYVVLPGSTITRNNGSPCP